MRFRLYYLHANQKFRDFRRFHFFIPHDEDSKSYSTLSDIKCKTYMENFHQFNAIISD